MKFTVFTGDIVSSSQMTSDALDAVMRAISGTLQPFRYWGLEGAFARRGGDGWQMALPNTALGLRAALFIQANTMQQSHKHPTRIAIATGDGTLTQDLNASHGPAFTASGRLLEAMPNNVLMTHASGGIEAAAYILAGDIARSWTNAQAAAVAAMVPPSAGPRSEAAKTMGKSRQAVDQALHGARFPALMAALEQVERST